MFLLPRGTSVHSVALQKSVLLILAPQRCFFHVLAPERTLEHVFYLPTGQFCLFWLPSDHFNVSWLLTVFFCVFWLLMGHSRSFFSTYSSLPISQFCLFRVPKRRFGTCFGSASLNWILREAEFFSAPSSTSFLKARGCHLLRDLQKQFKKLEFAVAHTNK